ncbi:DUF397 domain-containing protein [Streptomyces sp. NPDC090052]|uniref:DUF397 domain-containing protein n=1 Tax=Streptomyces sp. NPDC090052 TaxID=3365931 RepID=UPI00381E8611
MEFRPDRPARDRAGRNPPAIRERLNVKSSYGTNDGPKCVEITAAASTVHVRDSKNIPGPQLDFTPDTWTDFVTYTSGTSGNYPLSTRTPSPADPRIGARCCHSTRHHSSRHRITRAHGHQEAHTTPHPRQIHPARAALPVHGTESPDRPLLPFTRGW